jgi:hypothetical protein
MAAIILPGKRQAGATLRKTPGHDVITMSARITLSCRCGGAGRLK